MKKNLIIFLFFVILAFRVAESADYVYLQQLGAENFEQSVINTRHVWLVYFYDSDPGHKSVLAELEKVGQALRGIFKVGYANYQEFSGNGYDLGKVLYFGDNKESPVSYTGATSYAEIVKFLLANTKELIEARSKTAKQLKMNQQFQQKEADRAKQEAEGEASLRERSDTIVLNKDTVRQTMLKSRQPYVVNYYVANCSACIELNKQWQGVSSALKGKVKVAKVNITQNEELEDILKITTFPVIRFYPGGVKKIDEIIQYGGVKKKTHILDWISKNDQKNQNTGLAELTAGDYKAICKEGKGTCVIFFVEDKSDPTLASLSSLPKNYLKKPISFFYSIKGSQVEFAKQFGITSYPNVLMTYCQRKTYWRLDHFQEKRIEDAVGQVMLGNRNNFVKYKFEEKLI